MTSNSNYQKIFLAILVVSVLLRTVPFFWGIPLSQDVRSYHPDEPKIIKSVLQFPSIYLSTKTFAGYGTFFQYTLGLLLLPFKVILKYTTGIGSGYNIFVMITGRFCALALSVAAIFFLYSFAKRIVSEKVALLASAFLAISPIHALNGPLMTLDIMMGTFLLTGCLATLNIYKDPRKRSFVLLGANFGILISLKVTMGLFVIIPASFTIAMMMQDRKTGRCTRDIFKHYAALFSLSMGVGLAVFIVYHPHIFMDLSKYVDFFTREKHDFVDRTQMGLLNSILNTFHCSANTIGSGIFMIAMIGLFIPFQNKNQNNKVWRISLILFIVSYYGFWRWFIKPRYITTIAPFLCLFAAHGVVSIHDAIRSQFRPLVKASLSLAAIYTFAICIASVQARVFDPRISAAQFIREEIPFDKTISLSYVSEKYRWNRHDWQYPKIDFNKYREASFFESPDIVVLSSYDLKRVLNTIKSKKMNADYVIHERYHKDWYRYSPPSPRMLKFYDELLLKKTAPYALMAQFKPKPHPQIPFPPPEIHIYQKVIHTGLPSSPRGIKHYSAM